MNGFDDDRGKLARVGDDDVFRRTQVIEGSDQNLVFDPGRACARNVGRGKFGQLRAEQTRDADRMLSVISAFKFQHFGPARRHLGHAKTKHRCFRS